MNADAPTLYALALCAHKETASTACAVNVEVGIKAWAVLAVSSDEAEAKGLELARERWPASEGWGKHSVSLCEIETAFLRESLLEIDAFGCEEAEDESGELLN